MGVYIVTGGANGIGRATADVLRHQGHRVISVDVEGGDITADLGTKEGRRRAIQKAYELCPEGIDGLACIAGIAFPIPANSTVLSVNYFGTVEIAEGLFELLRKKGGSCVVTTSGSLTWEKEMGAPGLAQLLTDCGDEERIARLVDSFPPNTEHNMYQTSKTALLRWARRHSVEWAVRGVRLNVIGPGCVDTRLSVKPADGGGNDSFHRTIPTHYGDLTIMEPEELGEVYAFVLSSRARGISGSAVWVDGGQESFYNTERLR